MSIRTHLLVFLIASAAARGGAPGADSALAPSARAAALVARMTLPEKVSQMQNHAPAIPRLGIGEYDWWSEALHGVAFNGVATVFPQAIGMAATWDPPLIHREADCIATEARAKHNAAIRAGEHNIFQGLTFWSPNINIFRDPRWGRGQETFGEDPFLTSRIGVAFVRGLQGDDPRYFKVIATPKHFAVHSGPEALRHRFDARIAARDLYETYLPAFEACVREGGAYSVMGAYNSVDGVPCTASPLLLEKNLRGRWHFPGYVVSDCGAISDIVQGHRHAADLASAAALAVRAGCDLSCGDEYAALAEAVTRGLITENDIDASVARLLEARIRLGMFDPAGAVPFARILPSMNDTPAHDSLALAVARESIVLLRNAGGALPLREGMRRIAVIGPAAADREVLVGNYHGTPARPVTILEGIRRRAGAGTDVLYAPGCVPAPGMPPLLTRIPGAYLVHGDSASPAPGLLGEYFAGVTPAGTPAWTRVDSVIGFSWIDSVAPGVPHNQFSARWEGMIVPPRTGKYTLGVTVDDGARMSIDGKLFLDDWHYGPARTVAAEITLEAGRPYRVRLEYFQGRGEASLELGWDPPDGDPEERALALARGADQIVAVMGLSPLLEGEEMPVDLEGFYRGDRTRIDLPRPQEHLLRSLAALGRPLVLVLVNGSALAIPWENEHIEGIVDAWYPGEEGGRAVADVLFGDYNPGGRLPVTFYRSLEDLPAFENYAMSGRTYRYFTGTPLYPFGYGLSYTRFEYRGVRLSRAAAAAGDSVEMRVTLANTGSRDGDEVVQVYAALPGRSGGDPLRSLVAFARAHLEAGAEQTVTLMLHVRDFRVYDETRDSCTVRGGAYRLDIGPSSADARLRTSLEVR